jgi:hypothetical protein
MPTRPTVLRLALCALVLAGAWACGDTIVNIPNPTQATPLDTKPAVITSRLEFRVTGNATSARIRYSTPLDGLVQTTTTLPFFTSFNTTSDNLFLSLEVTPINYSAIVNNPFLSAQILVNNTLFREATSTDFLLYTISVNGVWRR